MSRPRKTSLENNDQQTNLVREAWGRAGAFRQRRFAVIALLRTEHEHLT